MVLHRRAMFGDREFIAHGLIVLQRKADVDALCVGERLTELHQHDMHAARREMSTLTGVKPQPLHGPHCCAIPVNERFMN